LDQLVADCAFGMESLDELAKEMLAECGQWQGDEGPSFEPGTVDDQGKLDELSPVMVACPHCKAEFNCREQV
jgi:hypothetical protein